jgi:hypothetical protein
MRRVVWGTRGCSARTYGASRARRNAVAAILWALYGASALLFGLPAVAEGEDDAAPPAATSAEGIPYGEWVVPVQCPDGGGPFGSWKGASIRASIEAYSQLECTFPSHAPMLSGEITASAGRRLRDILAAFRQRDAAADATGDSAPEPVHIRGSDGGSLLGALDAGNVIRDEGLRTVVDPGQSCAGACVLIFMAGVERENYGTLDLRRPGPTADDMARLKPPKGMSAAALVDDMIRKYLAAVNVPARVYQAIGTSPQYGLGAIPQRDPAYEEYQLAIEAESITGDVKRYLVTLARQAQQKEASCAASDFSDAGECGPDGTYGRMRTEIRDLLNGRQPAPGDQ